MIRHPSADLLGRYLDGDLGPRRRTRTAAHLARCQACRDRVQEWRFAAEAIRQGPVPELSPDLFDRIRARRAAGERLILPSADALPPRRQRRFIPAAVAAVLLLALGIGVFLAAPELRADASELRLVPEAPRAGERIEAEYHASSLLSGHDRLVLRARYRIRRNYSPTDLGQHVVAAELTRGGDGVFRGSFVLPDSVVYAVFAVEDPRASRVDSNFRQGWELLVHGADGRPLFQALEERANDLLTRNWEAAHATARTAAELYPERPQSWTSLFFYQQVLFGVEGIDSLREAHRERLQRLHLALAEQPHVSGDDAGAMFFYAMYLDDAPNRDFWRDRLAAEHPAHPLAVQNRFLFDLRPYLDDPERLLEEMERLWDEVGPVHVHQGDWGLRSARRVGERDAILRWADRYLHFRPEDGRWLAMTLAESAPLREEGMRLLREEIRRRSGTRPGERSLFSTAEEQRRQNLRERRAMYAALGKALIESGSEQAGLDTLALAVAGGWDTQLFREVAESRLAVGDTSGAADVWAHAAVDPATSVSFADSVQTRLGERFDARRWQTVAERARQRMRDEVLADATDRSVRGSVRLADSDRTLHPLDDLVRGQATVVVFWSPHCGPAIEALPEIQRVAERLSARGARIVTVVDGPPDPGLRTFLTERGLNLRVYHDTRREAARAFQQWGTPQYFVLDRSGRIRFEYTSLEALERQVMAIAGAE